MEMQQFYYDNKVVKKFIYATLLWGIVGFSVGLLLAFMFLFPNLTDDISWLSFGRLRPLHTNAVIFAFVGNAIYAGIYYSLQRLLKARMASDFLSNFNFWGWQLIIVAAAITLPLGYTTSKEYAELEWPIDIAIALVWVAFGVNMIWTILKRRQRHLYVAVWFYLGTFVTVAVLHIFNSLALPVGFLKSYSVYAGVQDALVQWWYGHNAVAFFLTTPFLGLMYYFVPKAANRPVISDRLKKIARDTDTVARLGGDEFAVIMYSCNLDKAKLISEIFRDEVFKTKFDWHGKNFSITASIGIVPLNDSTTSLTELKRVADLICYQCKGCWW